MAGSGSLRDTAFTRYWYQWQNQITNKKDLWAFLRPQILDPGGAEGTDGTPVENTITTLRATWMRRPKSQPSTSLKTYFRSHSSRRPALSACAQKSPHQPTYFSKARWRPRRAEWLTICGEAIHLLTCKKGGWPQDPTEKGPGRRGMKRPPLAWGTVSGKISHLSSAPPLSLPAWKHRALYTWCGWPWFMGVSPLTRTSCDVGDVPYPHCPVQQPPEHLRCAQCSRWTAALISPNFKR